MKILSPNIIAIKFFLQNLEKGFYVDNEYNRFLKRENQPYGKDKEDFIKLSEKEGKLKDWKFIFQQDEDSKEYIINSWYENYGGVETKEALKQQFEEKQNQRKDKIESLEKEIKELKEKIEKRKEKYLNKGQKGKKISQEGEYLTKKELEKKYGGRFGRNEYPRTFTAAEQNHDRDLD